jgi:putative ABC transport system ATP-binding protein
MIEVQNLTYSYNGSTKIASPDFSVKRGGSCLLLGESGSGKTTLLHLLGGLLTSQKGSIHVNGTDITTLSEQALDNFRGEHAWFIFQKNHLIRALTVKKNLMMAPFLANKKQDDKRADEVLTLLGLIDKKNSRIQELSQGQTQRVAIARAVINKPHIIFADEPTSALDDTNCDRVIKLLLEAASQNQSTLLIATHDQRLKSHISMNVQLPNSTH